jgi:hypothetical protein
MNYVKVAGKIASAPKWWNDQCAVLMAMTNENPKCSDQLLSLTANRNISPDLADLKIGERVLVTGSLIVSARRGVQIKVNIIEKNF